MLTTVTPFEGRQAKRKPPAKTGNADTAFAPAPIGIAVQNVGKRYGSQVALADVSLDVHAGEFLTVLGPSGSGKTTLLNILAGFVRSDHGRIRFGDEDVTLKPVNQRGLGMVFQNYALFPHMTVGQNVAFPLRVRRLPKSEVGRQVLSALSLVKLESLIDRSVLTLSGGQRQRVALARAIVFSPRIVLMDEPLSALDKSLRDEMQVEIRHLQRTIGATTILVTHDQREAMTIGDRVVVMNEGRIVQCGTPSEIYQSPQSAFAARFIGETTLLPASRGPSGVQLADGTELQTTAALPDGDALHLVVRAEQVLMPDECSRTTNRFRVTVRDVVYQGDSVLIFADAPGERQISIRKQLRGTHTGALPGTGETLLVGLEPEVTLLVSG